MTMYGFWLIKSQRVFPMHAKTESPGSSTSVIGLLNAIQVLDWMTHRHMYAGRTITRKIAMH